MLLLYLEINIKQEYDLRNTASIEASVRHSDVVYNLVGRDYPTKYGTKPPMRVKVARFD